MSKKLFTLSAAADACRAAGAAVGAAGPMLTRAAVASRLAGADFESAWAGVEEGAESVSAKATGVYKSQFKRLMGADLKIITLIYSECERKGAYPSLGNAITAYEVPSTSKRGRPAGTAKPGEAKPDAESDVAENGDPSPTGAPDSRAELLSQLTSLRSRLLSAKVDLKALDALDEITAFVRLTK